MEDRDNDLSICLYIPKSRKIPDSDYDLTAFLTNGKGLGTKLKVTFRDEMLHMVMSSAIEFSLDRKSVV